MTVPTPALSKAEGTNNQQRRPRGAPPGNLNALKSGASSRQLSALAQELLSHPELAPLGGPERLFTQRLAGAIKTYAAERREAKERARLILAPYQPARMLDRLVDILKRERLE